MPARHARRSTGLEGGGNYVSEWFGHRVHPRVASTPQSLDDQRSERCPFLTRATGQSTACIKPATSKGICTISSTSNGARQDWLVCPKRALEPSLMQEVAGRLFGADPQNSLLIAAPLLASESARAEFVQSIEAGQAGFVYFLDKLGGEISIPPTDRSPELSFDLTLVEVQATAGGSLRLGKYGIMEIQTMDFHGSYRHVVNNLRDALRLHQDGFHQAVQDNPHWLSEQIEGPNIANVFKRTFYQMALKFQIGADEASAGCVLAIPLSVWDSWQRHLGRPDLSLRTDGTYVLAEGPDADTSGRIPAWIYVFDLDVSKAVTPDEIRIDKVIATDAEAVAHFALKVAPQAAVAGVGSSDRVLSTIRQRIAEWWPALAGKSVMP